MARSSHSLRILVRDIDRAADDEGGAAQAAQHRHEAALGSLAVVLDPLVPGVAHVRGDGEDPDGDGGACRAAADERPEVVAGVRDADARLLAHDRACVWNLASGHARASIAELPGNGVA